MSLAVLCPKCSVKLTLGDDRAGETFECPRCGTAISIPTLLPPSPSPSPPPPRSRPAPSPPPLPSPPRSGPAPSLPPYRPPSPVPLPSAPPKPAAFSLDWGAIGEWMGSTSGVRLWRVLTASSLLLAMLTFFMPWVSVHVVLPPALLGLTPKGNLELASQSGCQFIYGGATLHRGLEPLAERAAADQEREWRAAGKDPTSELIRENLKYLAPWMAAYPIALVVALFFVRSAPTGTTCSRIGIAAAVALFVTLAQVTVLGAPLVRAVYDGAAKEGGVGGSLLLSLYLDVRYSPAFAFAVLSLLTGGAVQVVWSVVASVPAPSEPDW